MLCQRYLCILIFFSIPDGLSPEQQLYILQQAQEQLQQRIINSSGKQLPSSSLTPLNNEQNGAHQGILAHQLPATQAGQTVGLQATDGCQTDSTTSVSSNNARQEIHSYSVKVSHHAF